MPLLFLQTFFTLFFTVLLFIFYLIFGLQIFFQVFSRLIFFFSKSVLDCSAILFYVFFLLWFYRFWFLFVTFALAIQVFFQYAARHSPLKIEDVAASILPNLPDDSPIVDVEMGSWDLDTMYVPPDIYTPLLSSNQEIAVFPWHLAVFSLDKSWIFMGAAKLASG